jgi:hypothetical protein
MLLLTILPSCNTVKALSNNLRQTKLEIGTFQFMNMQDLKEPQSLSVLPQRGKTY